jgi:hypothetical protein
VASSRQLLKNIAACCDRNKKHRKSNKVGLNWQNQFTAQVIVPGCSGSRRPVEKPTAV